MLPGDRQKTHIRIMQNSNINIHNIEGWLKCVEFQGLIIHLKYQVESSNPNAYSSV